MHRLFPLTWLAAGLCCAAQAQVPVSRGTQPMAHMATRLTPRAQAPATHLVPSRPATALAPGTAQTVLRQADGPRTTWREAEIPPQRLEKTRQLLSEMKADLTPGEAISVDLPADVLFDFDNARLRESALPELERAAELLRGYPEAPVSVIGHTDAKGSDGYNDSLSLRRAEAVARVLERTTGQAVRTEGRGRREPVAQNTTPDGLDDPRGRQLNRRVQILIELPQAATRMKE